MTRPGTCTMTVPAPCCRRSCFVMVAQASSSRTTCSAGRSAAFPDRRMCCRPWLLASARGRCCTSVLFSFGYGLLLQPIRQRSWPMDVYREVLRGCRDALPVNRLATARAHAAATKAHSRMSASRWVVLYRTCETPTKVARATTAVEVSATLSGTPRPRICFVEVGFREPAGAMAATRASTCADTSRLTLSMNESTTASAYSAGSSRWTSKAARISSGDKGEPFMPGRLALVSFRKEAPRAARNTSMGCPRSLP